MQQQFFFILKMCSLFLNAHFLEILSFGPQKWLPVFPLSQKVFAPAPLPQIHFYLGDIVCKNNYLTIM